MKGDELARGGRASFKGAPGKGLENDLKLLSAEAVQQLYAITPETYADLIGLLERGEALPNLETVPLRIDHPEPAFHPGTGIAEPEPPKQSGYSGEAFGESLLVYRVEKEHSSGLIIPDSMKARSDVGFVKSVGKKAAAAGIKTGVLVLFDKFAAAGGDIQLVDEDGIERECLLLKHYDVQLILKKTQGASRA